MQIDPHLNEFDVIVIGGSYAGLSAALQLARARRRVLVIDAGLRRNRFAQTSHGFLGQDGRAAAAIAADGREQLLAYPTVRWLDGTAVNAEAVDGGFAVTVETGQFFHGKRLVLASGVVDEMPKLEGLAERWGKSIFHCPYCHGYELKKGRLGVLATGPMSWHQAMMLPDWGQVTLFTNGMLTLDEQQTAALLARGVLIEPEPVARIKYSATIELASSRQIALDGLFTLCRTRMASPVAHQLRCAFDEGPFGPVIHTDASKETTVPGVFACGDAARMAASVAFAVGDGAQAGMSAHQSLVFR